MKATIKPNRLYPHLDEVTLSNGRLELTVVPQANMVMTSIRHNGVEVLAQKGGLKSYVEDLSSIGLPFMAPWINRLSTTEYNFDGKRISFNKDGMKLDENGYPMHGLLTAHEGWDYEIVESHASIALVGTFDYNETNVKHFASFPFNHRIKLTYTLNERIVTVTTEVLNLTDGNIPVAFGFHPHFNNVKKVDVHGVNHQIPLNRKTIPVPIDKQDPNDVDVTAQMYKMMDGWSVRMLTAAGNILIKTSGYPYMLKWTPPNVNYIAVEPMMSNIDLFNNEGSTCISENETHTAIFKLCF